MISRMEARNFGLLEHFTSLSPGAESGFLVGWVAVCSGGRISFFVQICNCLRVQAFMQSASPRRHDDPCSINTPTHACMMYAVASAWHYSNGQAS